MLGIFRQDVSFRKSDLLNSIERVIVPLNSGKPCVSAMQQTAGRYIQVLLVIIESGCLNPDKQLQRGELKNRTRGESSPPADAG